MIKLKEFTGFDQNRGFFKDWFLFRDFPSRGISTGWRLPDNYYTQRGIMYRFFQLQQNIWNYYIKIN